MKYYLLLLFLFLFIYPLSSQTFNEQQVKTAFLYNFGNTLKWPQEDNLDEFRIAVFGDDTATLPYLRELARKKKIKNLPIKIYHSSKLKSVISFSPQILYITSDKNAMVKSIYYTIVTRPILMVTDESDKKLYFMINFKKNESKITFEVNKKNIEEQNIIVSEKLIVLGGTELDVRELYKLKEQELLEEKEVVKRQEAKLLEQQKQLQQQQQLIEQRRVEIEKLQNEIKFQQQQLAKQTDNLQKLMKEVEQKKKDLAEKTLTLKSQQDSIEKQKQLITEQQTQISSKLEKLKQLNKEIKSREKLIESQKKNLTSLKGTVKTQQRYLSLLIVILFLIIFIVIYIYRSNKQKKKLINELKMKNQEIESQSEELRMINAQLEKLSVVASETDNAVIIMDKMGNFEWVNEGFTKLYGYTYNEFIKHYGKNILSASNNPNIEILFNKAIKEKRSVNYQNQTVTKGGKEIWTQTTLTPIFNDFGEITKLVSIDSDITKLKEAEAEIERKNKELIKQRDAIKVQHDKIREQNEFIRESIIYAQKLQNAILPSKTEISQFFDNFIIFKPRDIVSGDFYWFYYMKDEIAGNDKIFMAVVDCTGHGVPGAMMSMIGNRLLNEIIAETKIMSPANILETMDTKIKQIFKSDSTKSMDGMDLVLCRFDKNNDDYTLTFAGSKRPLILYDAVYQDIKLIKGTRRGIGNIKQRIEQKFENHIIQLKKGDILYLTTDGYIDQNNKERKRFGTPRFLDLLNRIVTEDLNKQKQILEEKLSDWQQQEPQRDDITIIALKIK